MEAVINALEKAIFINPKVIEKVFTEELLENENISIEN